MNAEQPTDPSKVDILIVGAGPAGISTALHLAQLAPELIPRTLILEKARHPRHKLCGGGLMPDAEALLEGLGLDPAEIPHVDVDWAHFDYDRRGFGMRPDPEWPYAFRIVRRHEFDAWLAGKARARGFAFREDTSVKEVAPDENGVTVVTDRGSYRAQAVVGADGSKSIVRRAVVAKEATHTARLLEIVTEPRPERSIHRQADAYFDFVCVPQGILGYTWDFPALEDGKPVRVRGIYDSNLRPVPDAIPLSAALADEFARHGYDLDDYKLEGHPLRWFEARGTFSVPRILLAGDAAGGDALAGEGISFALAYGEIAARAICKAFASRDFSFREYKRAILKSSLGRALRWRTRIARIFYELGSPRLQSLIWRKLGPLVTPAMQVLVFGWASRLEKRRRIMPPVDRLNE